MKYPIERKNMIDVTKPPTNLMAVGIGNIEAGNGLIETVDAEVLVTDMRFRSDVDSHNFHIII